MIKKRKWTNKAVKIIIPLEGEIFKEYKGRQISNFGRTFNRWGEQVGVSPAKGNGYYYICREKKARIVYTLFKGPIPEGLVINHIDGVKTNDHIDNLEAVTYSQNNKHAYDTGLKPIKSKFSIEKCVEIYEMMARGKSDKEICTNLSVGKVTVEYLRKGKNLGKERQILYNFYKFKIPSKSLRFNINPEVIKNVLREIYFSNFSNKEIAENHSVSISMVINARKGTWTSDHYKQLENLVKNGG